MPCGSFTRTAIRPPVRPRQHRSKGRRAGIGLTEQLRPSSKSLLGIPSSHCAPPAPAFLAQKPLSHRQPGWSLFSK